MRSEKESYGQDGVMKRERETGRSHPGEMCHDVLASQKA